MARESETPEPPGQVASAQSPSGLGGQSPTSTAPELQAIHGLVAAVAKATGLKPEEIRHALTWEGAW